jgi:hypothetical protein
MCSLSRRGKLRGLGDLGGLVGLVRWPVGVLGGVVLSPVLLGSAPLDISSVLKHQYSSSYIILQTECRILGSWEGWKNAGVDSK